MKTARSSRIKKSTRVLKSHRPVSRRGSTNQQLKLAKSFQASRALMVVGLLLVGAGIFARFALATDNMTTEVCNPVQVTDISKFVPTSNQVGYSFVSLGQGKTATAVVKSGSRCLNYTVSLVSYQRTSSQPGDKFPVFDSKTVALTSGATTMQVKLPNCGYEVDLAYGLVRRPGNGQSYSSQKQLIWGVQGGSGSCGSTSSSPSPANSPSPTRTATPPPSPSSTSTSTPTPTPTATPSRTPSPSPVITPTPTPTPTPTATPTPTPGAGGGILTPTPTPSPIPGENPIPTTPSTTIFSFIPQTGSTDLVMIFFGSAFTALGSFLYIRRSRHFKRR